MAKTSYLTSEMRLRYLQRRVEELQSTDQKLADQDFEFLRNIGHQIKGNAATFEFPSLTDFGVSLEKSAGDRAGEESAKILSDLKLEVDHLLEKFEKKPS